MRYGWCRTHSTTTKEMTGIYCQTEDVAVWRRAPAWGLRPQPPWVGVGAVSCDRRGSVGGRRSRLRRWTIDVRLAHERFLSRLAKRYAYKFGGGELGNMVTPPPAILQRLQVQKDRRCAWQPTIGGWMRLLWKRPWYGTAHGTLFAWSNVVADQVLRWLGGWPKQPPSFHATSATRGARFPTEQIRNRGLSM